MPDPLPPIPETKKEGVLIGALFGGWEGWKSGGIGGALLGGVTGALAGGAVGGWIEGGETADRSA